MKIKLLGTGSPEPSVEQVGSSYLVEVGGEVIVFDHGHGAHQRLLEAGYRAVDVGRLVLTHLHYDHCCDVPRLVLTRWDQGAYAVPPLEVIGARGTERFCERLFGSDGAFAPDISARINHPISTSIFVARGGTLPRPWVELEVEEVGDGSVIEGAEWRLAFAEVPHADPDLHCLACRLDATEGVFVYSGDCGPCAAMHELAVGADVLVHMCANVTGKALSPANEDNNMSHLRLAELARDVGVKTLVPTHIHPPMDAARERLVAEMAEIYEGRILWAEDLLEIEV